MNLYQSLIYDLSWREIEKNERPINTSKFKLLYNVLIGIKSESFHAVFLIRLFTFFSSIKFLRFISLFLSYRLKRRYSISIYSNVNIGPGLRLPHPYGIIIGNGAKIGKMVTIGQFVTIGGNMGKRKDNRSMPIIGDWTLIAGNSVVAGPINIGEDVIIGACCLVTKDIPSHSVVSTSHGLIINPKINNNNNPIVWNKYFNYSQRLIDNFI